MRTIGIAAGALVCAAATAAFAQSPSPSTENAPPSEPGEASRQAGDVLTAPVRAPNAAFELGVRAGYTQGFGSITSDRRVGAGPGGTVGVSLDDRINPRWSIGVSGQYQAYGFRGARTNTATLRGTTVDIHGTYHMSPYTRFDPYITVGSGYRLFVESPQGQAPARLTHAIELGKIEFGADVRPSESVGISPVIGADLNLFLWRAGGRAESASLSNKTVNTFVFAGVNGRFDVGGTRESSPVR
ncbi:hypothetical protein [Sorangium sp. So ce131]|uniref:hypothetical protein n=1 Tax=Sorangium sp. So ce131 TaxID=3133282 RepID=UPI003F5F51B4